MILLELIGGHEEILPCRVEAARARVARQLGHIDLHAEQFAQRVLVFAPVQAPHRDDALLIIERAPRRDHHVREVIEEVRLRRVRWLFLILGGHLTGVYLIEHLLPLLRRLDVREGERQVVDAETAALLFRAVTLHAVLLQQRLVLRVHRRSRRTIRCEGKGSDQERDGEDQEAGHGRSGQLGGWGGENDLRKR